MLKLALHQINKCIQIILYVNSSCSDVKNCNVKRSTALF